MQIEQKHMKKIHQ